VHETYKIAHLLRKDKTMSQTILQWTSRVQYKKGTPYIGLIKHLSHRYSLTKGNPIVCKLVQDEKKLKVEIELK